MEPTLKQLKEVSFKSENDSDAAKEDAVQASKELLAVESPLQNLRDDQADVEMRKEAAKQRTLRIRRTTDEADDFLSCQLHGQFTDTERQMSLSKSNGGAICKMKEKTVSQLQKRNTDYRHAKGRTELEIQLSDTRTEDAALRDIRDKMKERVEKVAKFDATVAKLQTEKESGEKMAAQQSLRLENLKTELDQLMREKALQQKKNSAHLSRLNPQLDRCQGRRSRMNMELSDVEREINRVLDECEKFCGQKNTK